MHGHRKKKLKSRLRTVHHRKNYRLQDLHQKQRNRPMRSKMNRPRILYQKKNYQLQDLLQK
jgi:hypothetical protein|uniref:Uncharacterized protein n=1 Tax=Picea glauca TaxID=3330 RepID=A0A117NJ73_PICGL|nr:hypothetical protein ABT39_MTgene881 [Picea glauca]